MEKDNNIDIKEFLDMFDDDGNMISSIEKAREITIKAYIDRDRMLNKYSDAYYQYFQLTKLKKHSYVFENDIRFDMLFRARNIEEFYNILDYKELECLGW